MPSLKDFFSNANSLLALNRTCFPRKPRSPHRFRLHSSPESDAVKTGAVSVGWRSLACIWKFMETPFHTFPSVSRIIFSISFAVFSSIWYLPHTVVLLPMNQAASQNPLNTAFLDTSIVFNIPWYIPFFGLYHPYSLQFSINRQAVFHSVVPIAFYTLSGLKVLFPTISSYPFPWKFFICW